MVTSGLPLGAAAGESPPTAPPLSLFESIALLNGTRDLALEQLTHSLDEMLQQLEDALFQLAEKNVDRSQANLYLETRGMVQERRNEIRATFRDQFVQSFNKRINPKPQETAHFGRLALDQLTLVANEEYEQQMVMGDTVNRFRSACGSELSALDQRIGFLMQRGIEERDNPLGPSAITEAFNAVCEELDFAPGVRKVMLEQFNSRFISNVPQFYQSLNQHLVSHNIMPVISTMPRRNPAAKKAPGQGGAAGGQVMGDAGGEGLAQPQGGGQYSALGEMAQALEQGDWQQILTRLVANASQGAAMGNMGNMGAMAQGRPMVGGGMPMPPEHLMGELSRLQQHQLMVARQGQATAANILHELKNGALAGVAPEKESITIDIVAMLFDYIFDDRNIPSSIKALIGRLQIPVLKVAILDNRFFSKKSHPARKLLDSLANAAIGLTDEDPACQRLLTKTNELVHYLLSQFDDNVEVFAHAHAQLELFLAGEEKRASEEAAKTAKSIYERERLELAKVMAAEDIKARSQQSYVPEALHVFLRERWALVSAKAYVDGGEQGTPWLEAMRTVDDLVWSLAPKVSVEERMRLVTLLPDLIKRLENGLTKLEVTHPEKEKFFSGLVQYHAQAIKAGASTPRQPLPTLGGRVASSALPAPAAPSAPSVPVARPAIPAAAMRTPAAPVPATPVIKGAAEAARPATQPPTAPVHAARPPVPPIANTSTISKAMPSVLPSTPVTVTVSPARETLQALAAQSDDPLAGSLAAQLIAPKDSGEVSASATSNSITPSAPTQQQASGQDMKRGTLVEFQIDGAARVMKLAWISPLQGMYLFTNRDGQNAMSIDKKELQDKLKSGQARLFESTGLFDRAMSSMVSQMQGG